VTRRIEMPFLLVYARVFMAGALILVNAPSFAKPPPTKSAGEEKPIDPVREEATAAFKEGTRLVGETKWAKALASFERAQSLVPHAITLFNMGVCERALGRYTVARRTFTAALEEHSSKRTVLPQRLEQDAQAYLQEIANLVVHVQITVAPEGASLAVDGRPLSLDAKKGEAGEALLIAGILPPGKGKPVPARTFELEMDAGRHVLTFSRPGHSDAIIAKDFSSGRARPLNIKLDELPATIEISADQPGAIVTLAGRDFGPAPVSIQRPAGSYPIIVEKKGYVPAQALLEVRAGELSNYRATLPLEKQAITKKWWFWTIATGVVAGVSVGAYFIAREPPPPVRATIGDGSLGWKVPLP
jgi:PEGA domain